MSIYISTEGLKGLEYSTHRAELEGNRFRVYQVSVYRAGRKIKGFGMFQVQGLRVCGLKGTRLSGNLLAQMLGVGFGA